MIDTGFLDTYGIRTNLENEKEVIFFRDYGISMLKNSDPNTDKICEWLMGIFKYPEADYSYLGKPDSYTSTSLDDFRGFIMSRDE